MESVGGQASAGERDRSSAPFAGESASKGPIRVVGDHIGERRAVDFVIAFTRSCAPQDVVHSILHMRVCSWIEVARRFVRAQALSLRSWRSPLRDRAHFCAQIDDEVVCERVDPGKNVIRRQPHIIPGHDFASAQSGTGTARA